MQNKKVVHLTSVHPAFDTRIFHKECKSLHKAGYDVSLVVPHNTNETIDGIKILAVPLSKNRFFRMFLTSTKVFKRALKENADVYHFHDPELIPAGVVLRFFGKKVIYDVHEDLPRQLLMKSWIIPFLRLPLSYAASFVEWFTSKFFFSRVIVVTENIRKRFPVHKTYLVQNYPVKNELLPGLDFDNREESTFCFVGTLSKNYGIEEIVTAIGEVKGTKLILGGNFSNKSFEEKIKTLPGWHSVEYVGWLNRKELSVVLGKSVCGFVVYHPEPNIKAGQPNKLFEYMSANIPIIISDFPFWREIVASNDCGLLVDPLSISEIKKAINEITTNPAKAALMGDNGRESVFKKYNWENENVKLQSLYKFV